MVSGPVPSPPRTPSHTSPGAVAPSIPSSWFRIVVKSMVASTYTPMLGCGVPLCATHITVARVASCVSSTISTLGVVSVRMMTIPSWAASSRYSPSRASVGFALVGWLLTVPPKARPPIRVASCCARIGSPVISAPPAMASPYP